MNNAAPQRIIVWGASGHALVVLQILDALQGFEMVGFIDDVNPSRWKTSFHGHTILGGKEILHDKTIAVDGVVFGFGHCKNRLQALDYVRSSGIAAPTIIHPSAIIAGDVAIGEGTCVMPGAIINAAASIGSGVIINTGAIVEHECVIEDGAHICPGVRLAGNVHVGKISWVGIGSTVLEKVKIGKNVLLGGGSVLTRDIDENSVAYGVPAKVVRQNL